MISRLSSTGFAVAVGLSRVIRFHIVLIGF